MPASGRMSPVGFTHLAGGNETKGKTSGKSLSTGQDSNLELPEDEAGILTAIPQRSVLN